MDPRLLSPLIHIGYLKTGSTWLQKHLFDCPERGFFRLACKEVSTNHVGVLPSTRFARNFVYEPGGSFYSFNEFSPERIRGWLGECIVPSAGVPVLSEERLAGHPETGGFDSQDVCDRLSQVFTSPKIFIVIREQKSLIASCYYDLLLKGGAISLREYIDSSCKRSPRFRKRYFMFHYLISMYQSVFGKENVLVLPYEMFRDEPDRFFSKLGNFSGAAIPGVLPVDDKVNARVNVFLESRLRYLNLFTMEGSPYGTHPFYMGRFFHKLGYSIRKRFARFVSGAAEKKERELNKKIIEDAVGGLYQESNLKTSELIGIDLGQYGYPMPLEEESTES